MTTDQIVKLVRDYISTLNSIEDIEEFQSEIEIHVENKIYHLSSSEELLAA